VWIAQGGHESAQLHLNPPQLGPVDVKVAIADGPGAQATATFASPFPEVRDAIENALPQLREMLADSGITLGQVTVSAESFQQPNPHAREEIVRSDADARDPDRAPGREPVLPRRTGAGKVDTFA
jgi:flagellar hook-length control protein FliK